MPMVARFSSPGRLTIALALVHHINHVRRVDNHGGPFRAEVTLLTYRFLVYAIIAVVWRARGWRRDVGRTRTFCDVDTCVARYALGAVRDVGRPEANWLAASSPALGTMSVLVTFLVPLGACGVFVGLCPQPGYVDRLAIA